jgi:hypothetical protein
MFAVSEALNFNNFMFNTHGQHQFPVRQTHLLKTDSNTLKPAEYLRRPRSLYNDSKNMINMLT